ncbi:hypothetical protein [Hymenobacter volaticus]|uniref:Uncharacterized protein n=1 Tax=Hymenobacter volaticus TaxID=2932254 RepID=A0ABY4GF39_9BACT|nr:hypothetical protein [Hymenobacter volaticus]UOQ69467.1 hypothetical protein MUN86_28735 [Hymenobacter volaticus]
MSASYNTYNTPPDANSELAARIVAAMGVAGLIGTADEAEIMAMLTTKPAKTGEWRALLEKQLNAFPTISSSHASPDQGA